MVEGMTYLADTDLDLALGSPQAAACTYRIARATGGAKSAELANRPTQEPPPIPGCCVSEHGFSLHAQGAAPPVSATNLNIVSLHYPSRHCQRTACTHPGQAGGAHTEDVHRGA
jgi:hypothetical protein